MNQTDNPQPSTSSAVLSPSMEQESSESLLFTHFHLVDPPLGTGSFGCVYKAEQMHFEDNKLNIYNLQGNEENQVTLSVEGTFALKLIPEGSLSEVAAMSKVCHPNIVACYNVWTENDDDEQIQNLLQEIDLQMNPEQDSSDTGGRSTNFKQIRERTTMYKIPTLLVCQLEYCDEGTLGNWIVSRQASPSQMKESCQIFSQLVQAFVYLQYKGLVHGDLKMNNVLLKRCPQTGVLLAKLGDFGLSLNTTFKIVVTKDNTSKEGALELGIDPQIDRRLFLPPETAQMELIRKSGEIVTGATHKNDVYSLGLLWLCLLSSFKNIEDYRGAVFDAMQPSAKRKLPQSLISTTEELEWIQKMIDWDVTLRPCASDVKQFISTLPDYKEIPQDVDLPLKREEIAQSLDLYERLSDCEVEDRPAVLTPVFRKKYKILVEIISSVLNHIHPQDELFIQTVEFLNKFDNEGFQLEDGDAFYWFEKLHKKYSILCPDFESIHTLKLKLNIASIKAMNKSQPQWEEEGMKELEDILESATFKELEVLHPLRLLTQQIVWNVKYCSEFDASAEVTELESTLEKADELYQALTINTTSPLDNKETKGVLNVIVHILTKLGREEEAESKLLEIISSVDKEQEKDVYDSIICIYCKFLAHLKRYKEAINLMEGVYQTHLVNGNKVDAMDALEHLIGLSYEMESEQRNTVPEEHSEWIEEGSEMSKLNHYMQVMRLKNDATNSEHLLLDGDQLELDDSVRLRSRSVNFMVLDNFESKN